jgi:hypothetical protein
LRTFKNLPKPVRIFLGTSTISRNIKLSRTSKNFQDYHRTFKKLQELSRMTSENYNEPTRTFSPSINFNNFHEPPRALENF